MFFPSLFSFLSFQFFSILFALHVFQRGCMEMITQRSRRRYILRISKRVRVFSFENIERNLNFFLCNLVALFTIGKKNHPG